VRCDTVSLGCYLTDVSRDISASILRVNQRKQTLFLDCLVLKMKAARPFETSGSSSPATQRRFQGVAIVMSTKRLVMLQFLICYEQISGVTETSL
jgi:hypothetical protein